MDWKMILALVAALLANIRDLFPLPTINDAGGTRSWLNALVIVLKKVAAATPITIDDEAVSVLDRIVANDDTYAAFHTLLVNLFTKSGAAVALASCPCDGGSCPEDVRLFAEKAGFNPLLILTAIQLVLTAIEIIKNLRKDDAVAA